jgi:hypothetical protein
MNSAITLCGQKERRPHLTGGGNLPVAMPAHHVDGATPTTDRTSGRESKGSGRTEVSVRMFMATKLQMVIEFQSKTDMV